MVELHSFHEFHFESESLACFYAKYSILADFLEDIGDHRANLAILSRDRGNCLLLFALADRLLHLIELDGDSFHSLHDSVLNGDGVLATAKVLETFLHDGVRQDRCGCGSVSRCVVRLCCSFFYQLSTEVLECIWEFDFFRNSHTVFGNCGSAPGFCDRDVTTQWSHGCRDSIGELGDAFEDLRASVGAEEELLRHDVVR